MLRGKDFCYIITASGKPFNPKEYKSSFVRDSKEEHVFYMDADKYNPELYENLFEAYSKKMDVEKDEKLELKFENHRLSSDYIGPSRYWANKLGLSDLEIGEYLQKTRILGGHILWPKFKNSINYCRGGRDGYCDRIDYTLYELKLWYDDENEPYKLGDAFRNSRSWLENKKINNFEEGRPPKQVGQFLINC